MIKRVSITVVVVLFALGVFAQQAQSCEPPFQCPPLSFDDYGRVLTHGLIATYECPGYFLEGMKTSVCQPTGEWSSGPPNCLLVRCPYPSPPENGQLVGFLDEHNHPVNIAPGELIKDDYYALFSCNSGYELKGSSYMACKFFTWIFPYPVCVLVQCPNPTIADGSFTLTNGLLPGSNASFTCNQGFELKGTATITCIANPNTYAGGGIWTNSYPVCAPVQVFCPVLDVVDGLVTYSGERVPGSIATFVCAEGFMLEGPPTAQCLESGQWNALVVSTCVPVTCPSVSAPVHGVVTFFPNTQPSTFGGSACFACTECGYTHLAGEKNAWCQADGTWSSPAPICELVNFGCTQGQGYWKEHECAWPAPFVIDSSCPEVCDNVPRLTIGTLLYNQCELHSAFRLKVQGNAIRILLPHVIAAKLNALNGALTCFPVTSSADPHNPFNGLTALELMQKADELVGALNILTGSVAASSEVGQTMLKLKDLLELFNQGYATVPQCA